MHITRKLHTKIGFYLLFLFFQTLLTLCPNTAMAQRNELGVTFGGMYYLGDLNPTRQFAMTQMGFGALYRYNYNEHISFRLNGLLGSVAADDALIRYNPNRNLNFRSTIMEVSLQGEINFLPFIPGDLNTPYTPYVFFGGGLFRFNPQASYEGQWYNLNPHGTEGQGSFMFPERSPYRLISHNLLFGLGLKFNINRKISGGIEWGMRRTGTDYLDDVSETYPHPDAFDNNPIALTLYDRSLANRGENTNHQRGNPNTNDWYSYAGLILTFKLDNLTKTKCPAYK